MTTKQEPTLTVLHESTPIFTSYGTWLHPRHCQVVGDDSVTRQQKVLSGRDYHRPAL